MGSREKYDIHERIFKFIVAVIQFVRRLPRTKVNQVIVPQVLKSVTSMGANDQEADGAATKKEFIHRYSIVRKKGKETIFWLKLISETNPVKYRKITIKLQSEGKEIVAVVSSIICNASNTKKKSKN